MVADRRERLARQIGREPGNASVAHRSPLAMTAREARHTRPDGGAHDLRLLAAHELGRAGIVRTGDAGHDPDGCAGKRHRCERAGKIGDPGRAGNRAGLLPALPAADHSREQHALLAVRQPRAHQLAQHVREPAVRHGEDAGRLLATIGHAPIAQPVRPHAADPPVHADHARRTYLAGAAGTTATQSISTWMPFSWHPIVVRAGGSDGKNSR